MAIRDQKLKLRMAPWTLVRNRGWEGQCGHPQLSCVLSFLINATQSQKSLHRKSHQTSSQLDRITLCYYSCSFERKYYILQIPETIRVKYITRESSMEICTSNLLNKYLISTLPPPTPTLPPAGGALVSVTKIRISDDKEMSDVSSRAPELQISSPVNSKLLNDDK